jgi:hypothetical protein
MMLAEIKEVALLEPDLKRLWGRHIDTPKAGTATEASALDLAGWVLAKSSPAVAMEILEGQTLIRRLPLNHRRPDIVRAFPNVVGAENSGFRATISALGTTEHFELGLQAVLRDHSRVPLGAIRGAGGGPRAKRSGTPGWPWCRWSSPATTRHASSGRPYR